MPNPPPADTPATLPDHVPQPTRRCRHLTVKGLQCRSSAIRKHDYCFNHKHFRHPQCPEKGPKVVVPLLEDLATVQVFLSQIAQGLLSGRLTSAEARSLAYTCQIASGTFARPLAQRPRKAAEDVPVREPVTETASTPDGATLGPVEPYLGPDGKPDPRWLIGKYQFERECERNGWPVPDDFGDFPAIGWLTGQEIAANMGNMDALEALYRARLTVMREEQWARESQASLAAGLPDPHAGQRSCEFHYHRCRGPFTMDCCDRCKKKEGQQDPPSTINQISHLPLATAL
jgi:hypothetical protein